jgi:ketosteroid isomerase-like protein
MIQIDQYFMGYRQAEQERLQRQAEMLASDAQGLFDRIGVFPGARVVEIGCGPRGCLDLLAERVGQRGSEDVRMPAKNPEEICSLFQQYMAAGDIEGVLSVYDPEIVFLNQAREVVKGKQELKQELGPFVAARARFDFNITQVIQSGDIALMHTQWNIPGPEEISLYAIEVARLQPDGTWRWLIGDPFTVGRQMPAQTVAAGRQTR